MRPHLHHLVGSDDEGRASPGRASPGHGCLCRSAGAGTGTPHPRYVNPPQLQQHAALCARPRLGRAYPSWAAWALGLEEEKWRLSAEGRGCCVQIQRSAALRPLVPTRRTEKAPRSCPTLGRPRGAQHHALLLRRRRGRLLRPPCAWRLRCFPACWSSFSLLHPAQLSLTVTHTHAHHRCFFLVRWVLQERRRQPAH